MISITRVQLPKGVWYNHRDEMEQWLASVGESTEPMAFAIGTATFYFDKLSNAAYFKLKWGQK